MADHRQPATDVPGPTLGGAFGRDEEIAAEEEHLARVDLARLKASIRPDELVDDEFRQTVRRLSNAALVLDEHKRPLSLCAGASRIASVAGSGPGTYVTLANWMLVMAAALLAINVSAVMDNAGASGPGREVDGVFVRSNESTSLVLKYSLPNHRETGFSDRQPWNFTLTQLAITIAVLVANVRIRNTDRAGRRARLTAADYAVHVRDYPPRATTEELAQHFSQFGEVESVVLGYRFGVIADEAHRLLDVEHEIGRLKAVLEVHGQQAEERRMLCCKRRVAALLERAQRREGELRFRIAHAVKRHGAHALNGHAFVVFKTPRAANQCVAAYPSTSLDRCYRSMCAPARLKMGLYVPDVRRATEPEDVMYENLEVNWGQRLQLGVFTSAGVWAILAAALTVQLKLREQDKCAASNADCSTGYLLALTVLPAMLSTWVSMMVHTAVLTLSKKRRHHTRTAYFNSVVTNSVRAHFLSSAVAMLIIYRDPKRWHEPGHLLDQVFFNMASDAFLPLLKTFMLKYFLPKYVSARRARSAARKVDYLRHSLPPKFDVTRPYVDLMNLVLVCIFYIALCPWAPMITIPGIVVQQLLQRFLLLRKLEHPQWTSAQISLGVLPLVRFALLGSLIGAWHFYISVAGLTKSGMTLGQVLSLLFVTLFYMLIEILPCRGCVAFVAKFAASIGTTRDENLDTEWSKVPGLTPYCPPTMVQFLDNVATAAESMKVQGQALATGAAGAHGFQASDDMQAGPVALAQQASLPHQPFLPYAASVPSTSLPPAAVGQGYREVELSGGPWHMPPAAHVYAGSWGAAEAAQPSTSRQQQLQAERITSFWGSAVDVAALEQAQASLHERAVFHSQRSLRVAPESKQAGQPAGAAGDRGVPAVDGGGRLE